MSTVCEPEKREPPGVERPDTQSALSRSDFLGANGTDFSSFFFSRKARPPCRRSRPLNDVEAGLAGAGANEYSEEGALGSRGRELLDAEDSGRLWSSPILSFSLFFCRERK